MYHVLVLTLLALLGTPIESQSQLGTSVGGSVSDESGVRIPGVTITAVQEQTGRAWTVVTDAEGSFTLRVPAGAYMFSAELAGFAKQSRRIVVPPGAAMSVDLRIQVGPPVASKPPPKNRPPAAGGGPTGTAPNPRPAGFWWNAWPDSYPGPAYRPLRHLRKNTEYLLVLHLSGLEYRAGGVSAQPASGDLSGWVDDWLKTASPNAGLQVLLLPDSNFFRVTGTRVEPLAVDLNAVRRWKGIATPPAGDPLETIRANPAAGLPPFVFGSVSLRFRTTAREGVGAMALSIWSAEGRPVDEVALSYCISDAPVDTDLPVCQGVHPVQQTLRGIDSIRVAAEGESAPDAALHFVELDRRGMLGVFHDNSCRSCGFHVWPLGIDGAAFRQYLANTTLPSFAPGASMQNLAEAGRDLYNLLFPPDDADDTRAARHAFERFVEKDIADTPPDAPARSIFVRTLLGSGLSQPLYLPLGLATVQSAPTEFLGFRYRIEAPLERQTYRASPACVSRWFFAIPPPNPSSPGALPKARQRFETLLTQWSGEVQDVFDTIPELRKWLAESRPPEPSSAVVVVSHHDQNTLYFEQNERLTSKQVQRQFGEASVLFLNGCSTGSPVALDLIRQFNERGIAAVVASYVAISPEMAGDFVAALGEVVNGGNAQGLTVADLFFRAMQALRLKRANDTAIAYGPRALVFSLLGNGAVRLCPPRKELP